MSAVVGVAVWLAAAWTVGVLVVRAWSSGPRAAPNRYRLVSSTVDAVVALALVRAVAPPPQLLSWVWVAAAGAVGVGVAGAILRWGMLGWATPHTDGSRAPQPQCLAILAGAYAVVGTALVVTLA